MLSLTFQGGGPKLTEIEITALEEQLHCKLPLDYRSFLLRHNGGTPSLRCFDIVLDGETQDWWIDTFYSADEHLAEPTSHTEGETLSCGRLNYGQFVPTDCLIIGSAARDDRLLLRLHGERRGQIDMKFHSGMDDSDRECGVYRLAESFSAFLGLLY